MLSKNNQSKLKYDELVNMWILAELTWKGLFWSRSLDLQLPVQSVSIINVVSSNSDHDEMYSVQYYKIKFVSNRRRSVVLLHPDLLRGEGGGQSGRWIKNRVYLEQGKQNIMCAFVIMWMTISCSGYTILHTEVAPGFRKEPTNDFHRTLDDA